MSLSPRSRFLAAVRSPSTSRPAVSPFLPHPGVIRAALCCLNMPVSGDDVLDEIALSCVLDYEPMFMVQCTEQIFPWTIDEERSTRERVTRVIRTAKGEWIRQTPRVEPPWSDATACGVRTPEDHAMLVQACQEVDLRRDEIRAYYRSWRRKVGEQGVIVLGHPHPSWLGYQISPSEIFYQWEEDREVFRRSMDAVYEAALVVMQIALEEGIDFMSDSSYGLEMTSPAFFAAMDLPYIQKFSAWTHERNGLFWYHNCGYTRRLILDGTFNLLGADVIETLAPPPEGDNCDLRETRRHLDQTICSKGNFSLGLLRDGRPSEVALRTREMVQAVRGFAHIFSTADAVLPGTPPENFLSFIRTLRQATG